MNTKNIFKVVLAALSLVVTPFFIFAQSLTLSVSDKTIGSQDALEATYSFNGANAPQNISPDFKDWNVAGSNITYESKIVNNQSSYAYNFIFELTPKRSGNIDVPGVSVNIGGKTFSCSPVKVNVSTKAHLKENDNAASANPQDAMAALQQQMQQQMAAIMQNMNNGFTQQDVGVVRHRGESLERAVKDKILIRVTPSKTTCYLGEAITADYEVYLSVSLTQNPQPVRIPTFEGFSITDANEQNTNRWIKQLNGKNYEVISFRKVQLVPLKTGNLQLDVAEINFPFNYEDAANSGSIETGSALVKSEPITIHVLPLPKNQPADFSGAIGDFSISANVDKNVLPAQETNNLHIQITGTGTLNGVSLPKILFPSIIQSYDAKDSKTIDKSQLPMPVTLLYDVPFLGNKKGNAIIPPIHFSYFNSQKDDYETISTDSIKIAFSAPIVHSVVADYNNNSSLKYWWITGCIGVLALLLLFLFLKNLRKKQQKKNSDKENSLQINAENALNTPVSEDEEKAAALEKQEKLRDALLDLELEVNNHQFFVLAKALLIQYLQDELHSSSSSEQELLQELQTKKATKVAEVSEIFKQCNKALYMPAVSATEQTDVLKKLKMLIN